MHAQVVLAGTKPPPSIASRSCVYVIKRCDGMFYCGQSDNLASEGSTPSVAPAPHTAGTCPVHACLPSACPPPCRCYCTVCDMSTPSCATEGAGEGAP